MQLFSVHPSRALFKKTLKIPNFNFPTKRITLFKQNKKCKYAMRISTTKSKKKQTKRIEGMGSNGKKSDKKRKILFFL